MAKIDVRSERGPDDADDRPFPILIHYDELRKNPDCPRSVPWSRLAPYEEGAKQNHDQSLAKLASRGGLDPCEVRCIVEGRGLKELFSISMGPKEARDALLTRDVAWLIEWLQSPT